MLRLNISLIDKWDRIRATFLTAFWLVYNYANGNVAKTSDTIVEQVHAIGMDGPVVYVQHTSYIEQGILWCGGVVLLCVSLLIQAVWKEHMSNPVSRVYKLKAWLVKITL